MALSDSLARYLGQLGLDKVRRVEALWYGVEDGYLRVELDDGSVLLVAASWEGVHVVVIK